MDRKSFGLVWFLLVFGTLEAQFGGIDTLFRAGDLTCFSSLERKALGDFLNGNPDYLAMISAVNPETNERELASYRDWISGIISEIRGNNYERLSNEKKIARMQKYVSRSFLLKYDNRSRFDDMFWDGNYNFYTATSLFAYILDKLEIPYEIRELQTHIFLIIYSGKDYIRIETTKPGFQYFMFDFETRVNFVDFIHNQGVIDDLTYSSVSTRDLFQQYYFADYGLTIREMIGILYINSAIEMMEKDRQDDSYAQMEKAFMLYPCYKTQFMLLAKLNDCLRNMDYHNPARLGYLIKASRLTDHGVDRKALRETLDGIVDQVLVEEEDPGGFGYIYEYLLEYLRDEDLKKNFTYRYLYQKGRMEFMNSRYGKALDYLGQAYLIHPEDEATRNMLARSVGGYAFMNSPRLVLDKIRHCDTLFTGLSGEGIYLQVKMQTYLSLFGEGFQLRDRKTGEQYMAMFEKLMDNNPDAGIDQYLIGRSYSSAAIFYYRQGEITRSEQVLEKGLEYAPDNIELKLKLETFR